MAQDYPAQVNLYDVFEVVLKGPEDSGLFTEQTVCGVFTGRNESVSVRGFYDGDGNYRIRFMPSYEGRYSFTLNASFIKGMLSGVFYVAPCERTIHGPVRVNEKYHFAYMDGTPYFPFGTNIQDLVTTQNSTTLKSLRRASFNKVRFLFPQPGIDGTIVLESLRKTEKWIEVLAGNGLETECVLFHDLSMYEENDETFSFFTNYISYIMTRFGAYRNIWWSLVEIDHGTTKEKNLIHRLVETIKNLDPYGHLWTMMNGNRIYGENEYPFTHLSIRGNGSEDIKGLREKYQCPVIVDELGCEGNYPYEWNSLMAEDLVSRCWKVCMQGGYPGHSEMYISDEDVWSINGGALEGKSQARLKFLCACINEMPDYNITVRETSSGYVAAIPEEESGHASCSKYLYYLSNRCPAYQDLYIDEDTKFAVDILDTWNMTCTFQGVYSGHFRVELPSRPYMAVLLRYPTEEEYARTKETTKEEKTNSKEDIHPQEEIDAFAKTQILEMPDDESDYMEATEVHDHTQRLSVQDLSIEQKEDPITMTSTMELDSKEVLTDSDPVETEEAFMDDDELPSIVKDGSIHERDCGEATFGYSDDSE